MLYVFLPFSNIKCKKIKYKKYSIIVKGDMLLFQVTRLCRHATLKIL